MNNTIIIAEAGVNHNGDILLAKKLIKSAAEAGADYVKFQSFRANTLVTKFASQASYQRINTGINQSQLNMLKKLELTDKDHYSLIDECTKQGISFLSSAFDISGINFLKKLNIDYLKIPSGEITNLPYLKTAASFGKPLILSTGMASLKEIEIALDILKKYGCKKDNITVLHCVTEYPAPKELINLNFINTIKNTFRVKVGYSDHTMGIEIPIAAVAIGASIIEKHFTLDRNMTGPDHKASLEPSELRMMVSSIRSVEKSMGSGIKEITKIEQDNAKVVRKSLVATEEINKGDLFTPENIGCKRPGTGISPMEIEKVLGMKSNKSYKIDQLIEISHE